MFAPVLLFAGAWRFDRLLRYPFRLEAPFAPPTYDGKYLSMDWYLRAQVDVPRVLGSRRYEVEEKLTLLPNTEDPPGTEGSWWHLLKLPAAPEESAEDPVDKWLSRAFRWVGLGVLLIAFVCSLSLALDEGLCVGIGLFIVILLLAGFFGPLVALVLAPVWLLISWLFSSSKPVRVISPEAGSITMWLGQQDVARGGTLPLRLRFQAGRAVRIHQLFVMVQAQEVVGNTNPFRVSWPHLVFSQKVLSCLDRKLEHHELLEFALVEVPLPEDVPDSFTMGASAVRWSVRVQVRMETPEVVDENGAPEQLEHTCEVPFRVLSPARAIQGGGQGEASSGTVEK
jgi:hypothetical protein